MATAYTHRSNDHELKIGSTTKPLKLIRDDNGKALYQVIEDIPEYNRRLTFEQTSWIGGHGQYDFDKDKDDLFLEGQSIDTTQDGKVILGPHIFEVKESDGTDLDSAPVLFQWFNAVSELLCATTSKIYRYIQVDTGIDTDEALDTSETGIDCDADATTAIPVGSVIHVENEQMYVSATGTSLTVIRGFNGTTAATHTTNKDIYIYKWTAATTAVAGVTALTEYEDVMYAAIGSSSLYYYSTDGDSWTATDLADGYAKHLLVSPNSAATADVLWKSKLPNELTNTTNGKTVAGGGVAWSTPAYIGDISNNITGLFLVGDRLMIGKEDNLFHYDSNGGLHPLLSDLKHSRSINNFKYNVDWQTGTYFSLGDGLGEITSYDAFEPMGPLTKIDDIGKKGTVVGLASDKNYLYVAMDEGTNTHIYKGREVRKDGTLRWEWCPFVFLGTNACTAMKVCQHSATDRRLWFGYGTNSGCVILSDNPLADSTYLYAASGKLRMPYFNGTNQYWDKLWQSIVTETAGCTSTIKITPKYRKDAGTSWASLTAAITTNGTVKTALTTALSSNKISFGVDLETGTNTITPQLLFFQARGVEKPETVRIYEATYKATSSPSQITTTMRDFLRGGRTSTALIKFADLRFGQTTGGSGSTDYQWVVFEPGYPIEVEVTHEKSRLPELGIQVRMREVSFTIS